MRSSGIPLGYSVAAEIIEQRIPSLRLDPFMAFNFALEIEGLLVGGFYEVSGLESEVQTEEYQEGGVNNFIHSLPGPVKQSNLTLKSGLTTISTLWNWYFEITQGIIRRRSGTIMLLDQKQIPVMWWNFFNAYPVNWSGPEFNAESDSVAFESVELTHEGLTKPILSQGLAAVRSFI